MDVQSQNSQFNQAGAGASLATSAAWPVPLAIDHLVKEYGEGDKRFRAVNDVSFEIRPGEIFGLLGPNGAGKTTLISNIVTLENPTSGEVRVFGLNVQKEPERAKMLMGFVPQELIHHGYFDIEEIMEFHSGYFGRRKNTERIHWLLHKLSLFEHRKKKVKQLSGGMKRRLLIAKSLVHEPRLLLLDEPTAGVDLELRTSLWRFVEELRASGMSILLTTHYIQEAEQLCDRVAILQKGVIKKVGETKGLIKELTKREVILRFKDDKHLSDADRTAMKLLPRHAYFLRQNGRDWSFQVPSVMGAGDLLSGLGLDLRCVDDLLIKEGNLEDALLHVLGEKS